MINASIAPLVGKNGARLGRLILLDDITQRVRLEDQMVQTEKLTSLGLLAAGVAHEVNTPLAVISNYIQMLAKQIPADDPRQKTIERIVKQTFRASEIVNNLLNFSRTGAAEFIEVDINTCWKKPSRWSSIPLKPRRSTSLRITTAIAAGAGFHHPFTASVPESFHERARCHAAGRHAGSSHRGAKRLR